MLPYRVVLCLAMIACLAACASGSTASRISTTGASASIQIGTTPTTRATVSPQSAQPTKRGQKAGFETSRGWCGPDVPLPRTTMVIDFEPDGVHPTCTSLGPNQQLVVANLTNMDGYAGSRITVLLPGQPEHLVAPGAKWVFPGTGDEILHEVRTTLNLRSDLSGLGDSEVTLWRVNSNGLTY